MADTISNFSIFLISESGGLLIHVNEEIPCKILNQQTASSSSEIIAM